ncbi:MAG: CDP-diacylglycerol--glycerol-3-phosphate 3-phosphatidyltransferase [Clostridia bacterium]|nr:CDP-diacylglycerol--glycerol-3-phosphate 3-phosphatidyltransferase [Clostridia bacterium]
MNLPNKLTILRVLLIPVFMILYSFQTPALNIAAAIVYILACLTDLADGKIARKYNLVTNFGKFADPLADKLLILAALCMMLDYHIVAAWVVMIILAREFIVTGFRLVAVSGGKVIAAGWLGKIKTTLQMITVIAAIIFGKNIYIDILFYLSAFITAVSGIQYIVQNRNVISDITSK